MTLAEVLRAVPHGSRRARDQVQALHAAMACPDLDGVQDRKRRKLEAFIRIHILHASWGGEGRAPRAVSSPGRDRVCGLIRDDKTGKPISHTTYKRLRRWWQERGYIAIAREGWTPDLRHGALHGPGRDHNMSQAYVICVPRRPDRKARRHHEPAQAGTGPLSTFSTRKGSPARAREGKPHGNQNSQPQQSPPPQGRIPPENRPRDPALRHGVLARVSDRWWSHLTRRFAGLRPEVLLWVIDHYPDGRPHLGTDDYVRNPAGWLRWRLSHWLNPDGTRKPTPDEQAAERARRHREDQARRHAETGIAARSARLRAERGTETAAPAPQRPWEPLAGPPRGDRVVGWAVPRYGTAPVQPASGPRYSPTPEWEATVAAIVAAVEAEEAAARHRPDETESAP